MTPVLTNSANSVMAGLMPRTGAARLVSFFMAALAGSILLWVSAKTHVPFFPVPMTLQTLAIMLIAGLYGFRLGLAAVALYMLEGMFGLPVFSATPERGIGMAYMMGPTAGYLVGFIVATAMVGWFAERGADRSFVKMFALMLLGAASILGLGFAYLASFIGVDAAFNAGVLPFVLGDLVKVGIAALTVPAMARLIRR